jgi:hypothetical protein
VTASQNEKASWSLEDEVTYLAKLTPSPSGGAGLGAGTPGIEPGTVKVGFEVIAIPTAFENNRVQVRLNLSISQLNKIGSVGIGTGANALQIQTPEVSRAKNSAIFTSRSNVTTVLTAFRREFNQYDRRGLTDKEEPDATSSFKGKGRAETYYLLVTPVIL